MDGRGITFSLTDEREKPGVVPARNPSFPRGYPQPSSGSPRGLCTELSTGSAGIITIIERDLSDRNSLKKDGENSGPERSDDTNRAARLTLVDFRNYDRLDLPLGPGFHVVAGPNAQGKTNLLEALHLVGTGRLLRGQRDHEAIRDGADEALAQVETIAGTTLAVRLVRGGRKRAFLNGVAAPRASDLLGRLPCVVISAEDLSVVRGEPSDRRLWLDLELSALSPGYLRHFSVYKRSLEQRNALLKQAREAAVAPVLFAPWEEAMAAHGAAIRRLRTDYLARLAPYAVALHGEMGGGEALEVAPRPHDEATGVEEALDRLVSGRPHDVARGSTTSGPHRDDVAIRVGGREARLFGSQGQQRTAVIAIKMATLLLGRDERGVAPLLLLDDILSDLDADRRGRLVGLAGEHAHQCVLTCTEPSAAGPDILSRAAVLRVEKGRVSATE